MLVLRDLELSVSSQASRAQGFRAEDFRFGVLGFWWAACLRIVHLHLGSIGSTTLCVCEPELKAW